MQFDSLTEAPRNLKEGIDWLMALRGTDAERNLTAMGAALYNFLADKPVGLMELPALENVKHLSKDFMWQKELKDQWPVNIMLRRFNNPMDKTQGKFSETTGFVEESDFENVIQTKGVKPKDIAKDLGNVVDACEKFLRSIKVPDHYISAYSREATWEASCSKDPEACAVVFVGIAPMLYAGLNALMATCIAAFFRGSNSTGYNNMREVLRALGYVEPECRAGISAPNAVMALGGVDKRVVTTIYDLSGFWAFY
ncbi:hypothetical protein, conserved [Babesia ovata]|uniref:Uncharacterized protein n=1 Tax=Babesia ovata TaxID=189622 RepID=A0A2H6KHU2_9APIC|nr:uncharacterized protein BOVATA_040460 [Babesia ovata]GBE62553.1 hypothetical protein, conserved [Babesia ovata]